MTTISKEKYQEYLITDHWRDFSLRIKKKRGKCEDCGLNWRQAYKKDRQGLNVHHLTYERLGHEEESDVVVICKECHRKRHDLKGWFEFVQKFNMPRITEGSRVACEVCGELNGPVYYNVNEVLNVWVCSWCRE